MKRCLFLVCVLAIGMMATTEQDVLNDIAKNLGEGCIAPTPKASGTAYGTGTCSSFKVWSNADANVLELFVLELEIMCLNNISF